MRQPLRILLVQPTWDGLTYRRKVKVDERSIHPLALGVVAALSNPHEVFLVDEAREPVPDEVRGWDLAGISVNTFNAGRAYSMADRFRAQGLPVVLGGPHTSLQPEVCLQHADSVVLGDAEDTWPILLQDFAEGRLQSRYVSCPTNSIAMPAPRRDLFRKTSRHVAYCQISRGCSNQCRFCYLQYMPCKSMRLRSVASVVEELRGLPQSVVLFVDDNLFCEPDYAKDVFRAIAPLGKRWWIQAPANLHHDPALIPAMAKSGCYAVSIGFQTASNRNNQQERILQNRVEDYQALVQCLHRHGILVDGTFIFGFDGDDPATFDATEELIIQLQLDSYTFYFLTPYPDTDYFRQFDREGRILHRDWSRFDWDHVVIHPKQLSPEELSQGVKKLYQKLDRRYFWQNSLHQFPLHRRNIGSPALLSFLISTSWSYFRSPVLRE